MMGKEEINKLAFEIFEKKKELAEMRRKEEREEVQDYEFQGPDESSVKLSELFGDKSDLVLVHNMGTSCPYCTLWGDGYNGLLGHLENRAGFVVVSPDDPATQQKFAKGRGWNFKMFSGLGSTFTKDMGYESEESSPMPGVSSFIKDDDGKIFRVATAPFGPGDDFCAAWPFFDLLAEGANGWSPKFSY